MTNKMPSAIERLPDWQREALQNAVLCAAQQGKVLLPHDAEAVAETLNRLNGNDKQD